MRLGEVCEFIYGKGLDKKFRSDDGKYPAYGANGELTRTSKYNCSSSGIVIGRKGSAGAVRLVEGAFYALDVTYYIPEGQFRAFSLSYLEKLLFSLNLPGLSSGIKPGLNRENAYKLLVALPPLAEQRRIAMKVDELIILINQLREVVGEPKLQGRGRPRK